LRIINCFFKNILENSESDLYKKYKDVENDVKYYKNSYDILEKENKNYQVHRKPVHHHLYVKYEKIPNLEKVEGFYSEQKMIKKYVLLFIR